MNRRIKYVLTAQALVILLLSSMAAYAISTYPDRITRMVLDVVFAENNTHGAYDGPFASNLEYDGVVPNIYLKDREVLKNTFDKHVATSTDFGAWKELIVGESRASVSDLPSPGPPPWR